MAERITVVLSQGQSKNPAKTGLEETIVAKLIMMDRIDVLLVPHLHDLRPDGSAMVAFRGLSGDFILLSWLYPRAAHWILDRRNIRGRIGPTALTSAWADRNRKWEKQTEDDLPDKGTPRVLDNRPLPDRTIYHLDLRTTDDASVYLGEIERLVSEIRAQMVGLDGHLTGSQDTAQSPTKTEPMRPTVIEEPSARRWYPVIDFGRCTNCMECIDFCLFGVYGIDAQETILVEQPDNCRKGCPACSRVCPENAIIFPQHKTPAIAGDPSIGSEIKIDLSQLFGKPTDMGTAVRERDEHLRLSGRDPVGTTDSTTTADREAAQAQKDELDELIDELDALDL